MICWPASCARSETTHRRGFGGRSGIWLTINHPASPLLRGNTRLAGRDSVRSSRCSAVLPASGFQSSECVASLRSIYRKSRYSCHAGPQAHTVALAGSDRCQTSLRPFDLQPDPHEAEASPYPMGDFHLLFFASLPGALSFGSNSTVRLHLWDGSLPLDSFRAVRVPATEAVGQHRTITRSPRQHG